MIILPDLTMTMFAEIQLNIISLAYQSYKQCINCKGDHPTFDKRCIAHKEVYDGVPVKHDRKQIL